MKRINYIIIFFGLMFLASCNKDIVKLDTPDFDVSTSSLTYKAGVPIEFNITGNAHVISFYSGETLKEYAYKDGRVIDAKDAGVTMEFSSSQQSGTQKDQISLYASTNFNGDYSSVASVKAATWTDITSRFAFGTNATFKATGKIDVSDITVAGKPTYFAFKYVTKSQATNGLATQWYIQSLYLRSTSTLANNASATPISLNFADQNSIGFQIIDDNKAHFPARSTVTSTRLTLYGNEYIYAGLSKFDPTLPEYDKNNPKLDPTSSQYDPFFRVKTYVPFDATSPYNDPESEHWAVSAPISLNKFDFGPDLSTAIKAGIAAAPVTIFRYTYALPGTYEVAFTASNNSIDGSNEVVKKLTLTITN